MDLELIVRTSALLALAGGLARLLHKGAPATRHLVWHASIVMVVLAPVLVPLVPRFDVPVDAAAIMAPAPVALTTTDRVEHEQPAIVSFPALLDAIAVSGSVLVGGWFLLCWCLSGLSVWRGSRTAPADWTLEARRVAARLGFTGRVDVRETRNDGSPHVAGLFRSIVMMPPSAREWTADERQAAFVHELTHIRRGDRRTQALAQVACAIYWFNPLVWHAAAAMARERERACDDEVLRVGVKPSAYAALLLDLARRPAAWTPATALSMARRTAIEGRLLMILADVARAPRPSTRWLVGIAVAGLTTAVLGAQRPGAPPLESPIPSARPAPLMKPQAIMQLDEAQDDHGITDTLVRSLNDGSGQVREQAALGLALTPGSAVIDPLLAALKDRDSQVREKAAIGLAFRRDPRIIEPLLAAMSDEDGQVREKAAIALGASGDARAFDSLKKATADPDPQVREKAVAGLVMLGLRR
jgi:beta-lactamase regulating signal transducer with metallopeptidase domain